MKRAARTRGPEREFDMSYKTILVHVDTSSHVGERVRIAAAMAMMHDAHLIGTAATGLSRCPAQTRMLAERDPGLRTQLDFLRQRAWRGMAELEAAAKKLGLISFEQRLTDDDAGNSICQQARYADLVVIGQSDPDTVAPLATLDLPQYVVLHSGRPVLLIPHSGCFNRIGCRVLIGWNCSKEAARAVTGALPLLKLASTVDVAIFLPRSQAQLPDEHSGAELAAYLQRHGVRVNLVLRQTNEAANALLSLARDLHIDLIVMGGYGHHLFRDALLGGATSRVLEAMPIPVLTSH